MADDYSTDQPPGPFLRRKLQEAGAAVVELSVLGVDGTQTKVDSWPVSLGLEEIRDEIETRSARHASLGPSLANFIVKVLDSKGAPMGFDSFRVSAQIAAGRSALMSEPANEGGVTAMLMRHTEAMTRLVTSNMDRTMHHQNERLAAAERRASVYEENHFRMLELVQDLEDRKAARDRESRKLDANIQFKADAFEKVKSLSSVVLDAVVGKTPQGAQAAAVLLAKEVFSTIRPEQLTALLASLDQDQQLKVLTLYKRLAAEEEEAPKPNGKDHAH